MRLSYLYISVCVMMLGLPFFSNCSAPQEFSTDDIETGSLAIPAGQEFEVAEYSAAAVEKSLSREALGAGFIDADGDGIPDGVKWGEREICGDVSLELARGLAYRNSRCAVFYPAEVDSIPAPGESKLLGFIHYFDDYLLDATLAVVLKQKDSDAGKTGTQVAFIGASGERMGNPAYAFYSRAEIESFESYPRWAESGLDYALAADPRVDAFFIILKDLGLPDEVMIIAFKWF